VSASASPSGSRPSDGAQEVSTLSGFDPSRIEAVARTIWHAQWEEKWPREGGIEHAHALEVARAAIGALQSSVLDKVNYHLIEARRIMYDEHWLAQAIDQFLATSEAGDAQ
jgi:hypothetical protein